MTCGRHGSSPAPKLSGWPPESRRKHADGTRLGASPTVTHIESFDLLFIFSGSHSLTNPIFLLVLMIAAGLIVLLDIGAVIAGMMSVFT